MRRILTFVAVCFIFAPHATHAQPNVWVQSNGPYGGFVNCLVAKGNGILAGTQAGIFGSSDQGDHWARMFPTLGTQVIVNLAIAPDGTILAATNGNGVLVSTDGGTTWNSGAGLQGSYPSQVLVSRTGSYFALSLNVYKSTDRGASWHLSGGASSPITDALCEDSSGNIYTASVARTFRSTDDGETWTKQLPGLTATDCYSIQANAAGDLFAATDSMTYLSTDQGKNWTALTNLPKFVSVLSTPPDLVYAAGYWTFFKSTDLGGTWTSSIFDASPTSILPLSTSTILVGALNGVLRSNDGGTSWTKDVNGMTNTSIGPIVAKASGDVFAAAAGVAAGVFHSSDNGASWAEANLRAGDYAPVSALALLPSGSVLAATRGSGLFRTTDNAASWQPIGTYLSDSDQLSLAVAPDDELLIGTYHSGVYHSGDGGNHWVNLDLGLTDTTVWAVAFDSTGDHIVASEQGIAIQGPGATEWIYLRGPQNAHALGVSKSGTVYLADYSQGILKGSIGSADTIVTQNITAGLPDSAITSITLDEDTLYVTTDMGIYRSTDEGANWTSMNDGLTGVFTNINSLAISPDGYLFAGTYGDGVFRSGALKAGVGNPSASQKGMIAFPNPCSDHTHLQCAFEKTGISTLTVINALGKTVAREQYTNSGAGMLFNTSMLVSGVYRFVLHSSFGQTSQMVVVAH